MLFKGIKRQKESCLRINNTIILIVIINLIILIKKIKYSQFVTGKVSIKQNKVNSFIKSI